MMTYGRTGKQFSPTTDGAQAASGAQANSSGPTPDDKIAVDGFMQVVEMLEHADPAFRESLLRRIQNRDAGMAAQLRQSLSTR